MGRTGTTPARAQVRVLGPVAVLGPLGPAQLVGPRQRTVVALLALKAGAVVPRWRLIDALWGDDPPRTAVKSLHSHVARIRQALDTCGLPDTLATRDAGYALMVPADAVDAWQFENRARQARADLANGEPESVERAAEGLRAALGLWRHEVALADAEPTGWGAAEVERLTEVRLAAIEDRWDAELRLGGHAAAIDDLERTLVAYPLRERMVGLLMLALCRAGRHAQALDAYRRIQKRLADVLGVDPSPELDELYLQILRRDPGLDRYARPAGDPSTLVAAPVPRRETVAPMPRPAQLPAPVGHFTGRAGPLDALDGLVDGSDPDTRIVVISGAAGIGKTALAVQWAHQVADRYPDGQLFVDLRGHEPGSAVPPGEALAHMLRSLGVPADRVPAEPAEAAALYRSLLHDKRILVVCDNVGSAESVLPLVPASATNLLLVTGRRSLAALATHHATLQLSLDVLTEPESVELLGHLLGRSMIDDDPAAATELTHLCGQMPLALRIAAAKLAGQPGRGCRDLVAELAGANRLDVLAVDGDVRSVRTVLASAYRALRDPAARLFRLLGLHPGPTFTAHVAAAMADLPVADAAAAVGELVSAHLAVAIGSGRYRYHDLIRLFASQCATMDEPVERQREAVTRLLDWYLAVGAAANRLVDPGRDRVSPSPHYPPAELPFRPDLHAALAFLDDERGNLLPIVRYAAEHGHPTVAWQMTYLLTGFFDSRGPDGERLEMCRWAVTAARHVEDPAIEGLMRSGLGVACIQTRRFSDALESLREALPLMRACGDRRGEGHVYNNIAAAYSGLRRFDDAVEAFRKALAVHTANGHRLGVALALNNTGHTYVRMGRPELGAPDLSHALEISREIGNVRLEAAVLHSLGEAALRGGDPDSALGHFGAALARYREIGDRRYEAETLTGLGLARLARKEYGQALDQLSLALALTRDMGDQHLEAITLTTVGRAHLSVGDLTAAREHLHLALALRARVPDPYEEALLHRDLGELADLSDAPDLAGYHWRTALRLYQNVNAREEAEELAAHLRARPARIP